MPREQRINLQKRAVTAEALGQVGGGIQALQGQQYEAAYVPKSDGQKLAEGLGIIANAASRFSTQKAGELQRASDVKRQADGHEYATTYINNANETISQLPIAEQADAYEKSLMKLQDTLAKTGQIDPKFYSTVMSTATADFAALSHQATLTTNGQIREEDIRKFGNLLPEVIGKLGTFNGVERVGTMNDAMQMALESKYFKGPAEARDFVMSYYLNDFKKRLASDSSFFGEKSRAYIIDHFTGTSADGQIDLVKDRTYGKYFTAANKANTIQRGQVKEAQKQAAANYYVKVSKASYVMAEDRVQGFDSFRKLVTAKGSDGLPILSRQQQKELTEQFNITNSDKYSIDVQTSGKLLRTLEDELWTGNANKDDVNAILKDLTREDQKTALDILDAVSKKEYAATIADKNGIIREEINQYFAGLGYSKNDLLSLSGEDGHMEHAIRSKIKQKTIAWRQEQDTAGNNNMLINLDVTTIKGWIKDAGIEVGVKKSPKITRTSKQTQNLANLEDQAAEQKKKSTGYVSHVLDFLGLGD